MILRMPEYCKDFRCIADKCNDSCCIGWEIDIDDKTAGYYKGINGLFGERLRNNISSGSPKSFILDSDERCPFLNSQNLCDIIINIGEDNLCQICTDHPRYYEWFSGIKEGGIGLCCEEAARIILSQTKLFSWYETEIPDEDCFGYDEELFHFLLATREKIILHLQKKEIPLQKVLADILAYTEQLQYSADNGDFTVPEINDSKCIFSPDIKEILKFLTTLEANEKKWKPYLNTQLEMVKEVRDHMDEFEKAHPESCNYIRNIAVYFTWRYFLKGVFDGEFLSRVRIMAASTNILKHMFCCKWLDSEELSLSDCAEITKNYSKEIEYSEENMETFADASYEIDAFFKLIS